MGMRKNLTRTLPVRARSDTRDRLEHLREMALTLVADHRRDLAYGKGRLCKQLAGALQPQVSQIDVRRNSADLFEEPREMIFREIGRGCNLLNRNLASKVVVHELNRTPQTPVHR